MGYNFRKSKHAQAEVITTVLIILLVLVAVIIVWNVVNRTVKESAEDVGINAFKINLEIEDAKVWMNGGANVTLKRGAGEGEISSLKFVFDKYDGNSEIVMIDEADKIPEELETKVIDFTTSEYPLLYGIKKISVVPMLGEKIGMEVSEPESAIEKDDEGNRVYDAPAGAVSWWKFDGNAEDSVGENDGIVYGGANLNYDDAVRGKVASFDGVDDYVNCGTDASLNPYTAFSIEFWANISAVRNAIIGTYGGYIGFYLNSNSFGLGEGPTSVRYLNCPVTLNSWTHVVATYDGTNARCYIDGTLYSGPTAINADSWTGQSLTIMKASWYYSYVGGKIDDVMIFNKSLSAEEVAAIYNNQKK